MTTCHICGRVGAFKDSATGQPLCGVHANHRYRKAPFKPAITVNNEWARLADALRWRYGPWRTEDILRGADDETNLDIDRWRRLGAR